MLPLSIPGGVLIFISSLFRNGSAGSLLDDATRFLFGGLLLTIAFLEVGPGSATCLGSCFFIVMIVSGVIDNVYFFNI